MLSSWVTATSRCLRFTRCAVGIEIQPAAVRVVVLSRGCLAAQAIRVEYMAQRELPIGAMTGVEFNDAMEIAAVIADALLISRHGQARVNRAVMALPNTAILLGEASLAQLAPYPSGSAPAASSLDALEQAVLAEAERMFRIEATELAIDWFQPAAAQHPDQLMIAAVPRHYVEAYLEVSAQAGLQLIALDEENAAALRACRFAALHTLAPEALYSVIWLGMYQSYVWFVRQHHIEHELFFSGLDLAKSVFIDKLQRQAQVEAPQQAFIAGEIDMLNTLGLSLKEIGKALGCQACAFDAALYCQMDKCTHLSIKKSAPFAVAFGLALRGVIE